MGRIMIAGAGETVDSCHTVTKTRTSVRAGEVDSRQRGARRRAPGGCSAGAGLGQPPQFAVIQSSMCFVAVVYFSESTKATTSVNDLPFAS